MTAKPCVIVTVNAPPPSVSNIVVDTFALNGLNPRPWAQGGQIMFLIIWKNIGTGSGTFNPRVQINDLTNVYGFIYGNTTITLAPNATHSDTFTYSYGEYYGDFKFCPLPNP